MKIKNNLKKFWEFLKEDSWKSTIVSLVIFLILIYFVIFPFLSFIFGTKYFLVIVESCSMYHKKPLEKILENKIYYEYNLSINDTKDWSFKKGFNKGDLIFSIGPKNLKVGDVIIYNPQNLNKYPIIHRIIYIDNDKIITKGDNNEGLLPYEKNITKDMILAKSLFRIPYIGWIKLIFFDWKKSPEKRGFCR